MSFKERAARHDLLNLRLQPSLSTLQHASTALLLCAARRSYVLQHMQDSGEIRLPEDPTRPEATSKVVIRKRLQSAVLPLKAPHDAFIHVDAGHKGSRKDVGVIHESGEVDDADRFVLLPMRRLPSRVFGPCVEVVGVVAFKELT